MEKKIYLPLTEEQAANLKAGENVLLSGIIVFCTSIIIQKINYLIEKLDNKN